MREYHLKRYHDIRNEAIQYLGGRCWECGDEKKLELDHRDHMSKKFEVSRFLSIKMEDFFNELEKCQLLCEDCHTVKTLADKGQVSAKGRHGTISTYRYCKCELCFNAKKEYMNIYWTKNKRITVDKKRIVVKK